MKNKPRVLFMSEGSFLNTGYGKYAFELLSRLHASNKYEVAELAAYGTFEPEHPMYNGQIASMPWKIYPNLPSVKDEEGNKIYASSQTNEFGRFRFEQTCLHFKPDVVLSIRDYWMDMHIDKSPYRRLFKWIHMPTVDAEPQKAEWLDAYARADVLLTYSDWAIDSLKKQKFVKEIFASAPPAGTKVGGQINKSNTRKAYGIDGGAFVVGSVMRNQPRKLYDRLFEAFAIFSADKPEAVLYCHAAYPDVGWNLPELMIKYGVANKVLFTYVCPCGNNFSSKFAQANTHCPRCSKLGARLAGTKNGVSHEEMSHIVSMFDVYCQIANSEGFGLPQVEAASVGVPVIATDYSAMSDVVRKLGGFPVTCELTTEIETGCHRAVPHISSIVDGLERFYANRQDQQALINRCDAAYSWDTTADTWCKAIDSIKFTTNWNAPPVYCRIPDINNLPQFRDLIEFNRFCYEYILRRPDLEHSYEAQNMIVQLTQGIRQVNSRRSEPFGPETAINEIIARANHYNFWEQRRVSG